MDENYYEISPLTLALVGERDENGYAISKVYELGDSFYVQARPTILVDKTCKYFGSSLKGRLEGTKEISGITHKPPIAIDPSSGIYMFPTMSPTKDICSWIAHAHISHYESMGSLKTSVTFKNNFQLILDISIGSFENQLNRTAQHRYLLSQRIKTI